MTPQTDPAGDATTADIRRILIKNGWSEDGTSGGAAGPGKPEDDDPLSALDITTHEDVRSIPIPEEMMAEMMPPEKDRIRRVAGGGEEKEPAEKKDPWSRYVPEIGKVSVNLEELTEYTRALLFDERFEIPVVMWMGDTKMVYRVRSLYISEREVMALAVDKIAQAYPIKSIFNTTVIADYLMKCCAAMQITSINSTDQKPFDARPEEGMLPEASPRVDELVQLARTRFGQTHQAKLKAMIRALHMFETKQQILEDAYYNRDFLPPADAY